MDEYLGHCRPLVSSNPVRFLFPARKDGAKTPARLAAQVKRMIAQETGIILNAHTFRHLSAMLFLATHPGEYKTVRLFLGHKSLNTTVRAYGWPRAGRRVPSPRRPHRPSPQPEGRP
jgi:integrase